MYKYNHFQKRIRSIVDKVLFNGEVVIEESEVHFRILENLKKIQSSDKFSHYSAAVPFPTLALLREALLKGLWSGKALRLGLPFYCEACAIN